MTLPTDWILPLNEERLGSGDPVLIGDYVRELVSSLQNIYQDLAQAANGDIRQYLPQIFGATSAGIGTYTVQDGWYLRKNLMVDFWFALTWTAHTGTGQAYIQLPYKVKKTLDRPFVGQIHGSYTYAGGYTNLFGVGTSDTFRELLYMEGPSLAVAPLQLLTSGSLLGHIRYIGQEIEN